MDDDTVRMIYHEVYNVWYRRWRHADLGDEKNFRAMLSQGADLIMRFDCDMARHMVHDMIDHLERRQT